ncbi:hypothetical protein B0H14DRAFT_2563836 [Mycena olivaceomarginata]|nr:hypothetical protein B0H14DRAFT_2563836 [Mycena olivaceomarginata]
MVFPQVFPASSLTSHTNVLSHEASKPTVDGALAKEDAAETSRFQAPQRKKKIEKAKEQEKTIFTPGALPSRGRHVEVCTATSTIVIYVAAKLLDISPQKKQVFVELLEALGRKLRADFRLGSGAVEIGVERVAYGTWDELERRFTTRLDAMPEMLPLLA